MRFHWVQIPLTCLALAATAACGTASETTAKPLWSAPADASAAATPGSPAGTKAAATGKKSRKQVCQEAETASKPFFDTVVNNAPTVQIGDPLPADYVEDVHREAKTFAAALEDLAAASKDAKLRAAFDDYAAKVRKELVDDADLSGLTPANSGWLLSLGDHC